LKCKFELTSAYDEADITGLFHTHLQAGDLTPNLLIDELEFLRDTSTSGNLSEGDSGDESTVHHDTEIESVATSEANIEAEEIIIDRASAIYALLKDMAITTEDRRWLR
jgi:hypothetical protein